jgi:3'-phosphoadenosine 5'-phosphosulfate (PAPS) 3'-phosphatase
MSKTKADALAADGRRPGGAARDRWRGWRRLIRCCRCFRRSQGALVRTAQWSRYWLVDPLDGTREFVKRNGEFTVNIA